ncbi:MAG: glutamate--cysteine ligase [Mycobacteriaceae bacterium]|nr:glutamate--cysteine ligase [Mycobacteriaceae bacterium]
MDEHPTVGVEEEFLLIDPESGEPVPKNTAVAAHALRHGVKLQLELTSCQLETTSGVTATSADLRDELTTLRNVAAEAADASGAQLLAVGLPPSVPHRFPVTDKPRYRRIAERFGMIAHEQGICGCHVHVAVADRAAAVSVSNWLRPWLPSLLALAANSAVYRGADTGYASWRSILWARWPTAGPPPFFDSPADYDATVQMMVDTGAALDTGMIYWDVRPSANYPTVEVRVADVPATVAETVLLATLIRASVMTALEAWRRGDQPPRLPPGAMRAAYWKAAHDGIDGQAIDLRHGRRTVPTRELLTGLVEHIRPALESLGEHSHVVAELNRVAEHGNGAMRQVRAWRRRGDVMDVIAEAAKATLS